MNDLNWYEKKYGRCIQIPEKVLNSHTLSWECKLFFSLMVNIRIEDGQLTKEECFKLSCESLHPSARQADEYKRALIVAGFWNTWEI